MEWLMLVFITWKLVKSVYEEFGVFKKKSKIRAPNTGNNHNYHKM